MSRKSPIKRVLVIDNESYIQEITKICLETVTDWQVITASSGREGIVKAETEQPDAILLDVMMPDMDGLTTFANLHANALTHDIPVILLSAEIQTADRRYYSEMGIKAAIAKPFEPLDLAHQIANALNWEV
ncbi:response regulator [Phormidesmis priestleyi]|uniref:response regulator n=1 Tax=Phormidesmis priestleyi TaxID=268141 RepID=UPI00083A654B|nr:response regulator [Phormidesmis priestleyi]